MRVKTKHLDILILTSKLRREEKGVKKRSILAMRDLNKKKEKMGEREKEEGRKVVTCKRLHQRNSKMMTS